LPCGGVRSGRSRQGGYRVVTASLPAAGNPVAPVASLQPVAWILRLHREPDEPDAYYAHTFVQVDDLGRATLRGFAMSGFTAGDWRAVVVALRALGVTEMTYTRRKSGVHRFVRVKLAPEQDHPADSPGSQPGP